MNVLKIWILHKHYQNKHDTSPNTRLTNKTNMHELIYNCYQHIIIQCLHQGMWPLKTIVPNK